MLSLVLAFILQPWQLPVDSLPGPDWWWYYLDDETLEEKMDKDQLDQSIKAWQARMDRKKEEDAKAERDRQQRIFNQYMRERGRLDMHSVVSRDEEGS